MRKANKNKNYAEDNPVRKKKEQKGKFDTSITCDGNSPTDAPPDLFTII